jgi:hypothetical protein
MCCILPCVERVTDTNLFARRTEAGSQLLVYQMKYEAQQPVAMILPIPVALPSQENAVRFIDLKGYPRLFHDLNEGFPIPRLRNTRGELLKGAVDVARTLRVESVGDFVASFVPSPKDFARVDPRFKLPEKTFEALPEYKDFGFVVFQFKELGGTPHPMAFEFPTRLSSQLFFPTVHIHDGQIHSKEEFDHTLYFQGDESNHGTQSEGMAKNFVDITRTQGVVRGELSVRRIKMVGLLPNTDTIFETARRDPKKATWIGAGLGAALLGGYFFQQSRAGKARASE